MKIINPADLVDIAHEAQKSGIPLRVELIYSDGAHPLNQTFRTAIYRRDAKMWMHRDLAEVTLMAAARAAATWHRFVLTDCLRTTDAQARMAQTDIVRANPHWTAPGPGMLISPPGTGAHPRGMAVDIMLETLAGVPVDMGTALDHFSTDPADNPAARDYPMPQEIIDNRQMLTQWMLDAAARCGRTIWPLPSEWWDFRFPPEVYEQYAPLADSDLPAEMRMCS